MTSRRIRLSVALFLALGLAAACGGKGDNSDQAAGGSATSAGTSSGGTSSSGTSSGGTTSPAGEVNTAGETTAAGGMPMQAPGCPAAKPEVGAACMRRGG